MDYDTVLLDTEDRMDKALNVLKDKYRGMRTGRANPGLVDSLRVDYYGSPTPLKQIANISAPEADQLLIKAFDPSALSEIEKAILKSDLGINPQNDGKIELYLTPLFSGFPRAYVKIMYFLTPVLAKPTLTCIPQALPEKPKK